MMSRSLAVGMVFVALGAGAGALTGASPASKHERALRGTSEVKLCNSIGCPDGFTPVPSALAMECDNNVCEVDQCCEAFCSYHACPDSFVPIENADSIRCRDNDCSTRQCCDRVTEGGDRRQRKLSDDTLYCNSIGCPDGFTPVPSAWAMECDNNVCEVDQCCEAFCSYHACPDSFVPIENADSIRCRDNDCSTRQCCDRVTEGGDRRQRKLSDDTLYCNSIGCPDGFTPVPSAWAMECDNNVCEVDQCCEAFCSYHACPDSFVPIENADSIRCRDNDCSTRQCCDPVHD